MLGPSELLQRWVIRKVVVGGGSREKPSFLSLLSSGENSEGGNLSSDIQGTHLPWPERSGLPLFLDSKNLL